MTVADYDRAADRYPTTFRVDAAYMVVRPHEHAPYQRQIGPGTILDLDQDGRVLGLETIGDVPPGRVLFQLLQAARFPRGT